MMKTKKALGLIAVMLVLLLLCFTACSAANKGSDDAFYTPGDQEKADFGNGFTDEELTGETNLSADRKIIKTFDISSETKDFEQATAGLQQMITAYGGYVESSSSSNQSLSSSSSDYARYATYTIRIPAEQVDGFVGSMGNLFHVTSNRSYVEDVSETYYSIEAKLEELQTERASLLDILNQQETKEDYSMWLTVHQRLSEVTQQIAVYQGQLNRYDSKIAYSTVNLSICEVLVYSEVQVNTQFGTRLASAFRSGWNGFVTVMQELLLIFAHLLPFLLLFALIGLIVFLILKAVQKRKNNP